MAIKVAVHRVCDRCQHPFDESLVRYGDALPKFAKKRIAAVLYDKDNGTDTVLFGYDDLCPDCERVVDGLIQRIRLEEEEPAKPKRTRKTSEKTPEVAAPEAPAREARFEPVEVPGLPPTAVEAKPEELPAETKPAEENHPF